MIKTLTNVDSYCFSCNYPFETTNFSTKALHQQFDPGCVIHICNTISFVKDVQIMSSTRGVQTIISTLK
jgi:hypothetical protein